MDRRVFRLQQVPIKADEGLVGKLVSRALGIKSTAVSISSLARSVDPFNNTKVATLTFTDASSVRDILEKPRQGSNVVKHGDEWCITVEGDSHNEPVELIMDTHFKGLTPLHDPKLHAADCIAISGLASHPFGSWQPKGSSKTYMWIRDDLPRLLPNIRPILYGYDTALHDHTSFQLIDDLSLKLIQELRAHGWSSTSCKPLIFLAHSLGGLILKQAIVTASDKLERDNPIVQSVQGAVFFGTPNDGMEQSHLMALVKGQYNEKLIADLSPNSTYLQQLDKQFGGISFLQKSQLYWFYETKASPTVICDSSGTWTRTGPECILVSRASATRRLVNRESKVDTIIPINEDHSGMVKFARNSNDVIVIAHILEQIISPMDHFCQSTNESLETSNPANRPSLDLDTGRENITEDETEEEKKLDHLIASLRTPDTDRRLREVEKRFENTFDWIYDLEETRFSHWLQSGTGLFWINGKPGSGKSTLMKFIYQDRRTHELLNDWKKGKMIRAAFFFHHRGNTLQKSFAGLLRSILSQIASECRDLGRLLLPFYKPKEDWSLIDLQGSFHKIVFQNEIPLHLCLFLDALDEYDGPLKFLCEFLKDLEAIQPSKTKTVKLCFSSRPWDIFMTTFQNTPGFDIQKFTQADIRDYCLGSIRDESADVLEELVPVIISRANGVFLWVKLVIKDLADATKRAQLSKKNLEEHLHALPTELDEYYAEIIKRISYTNRWKAYAMLEVVVRSTEVLDPEKFRIAVVCSDARTFQEAERAWKALDEPSYTDVDHSYLAIEQSREYCGGMVEVVKSQGGSYVQVLHQTVEDFVKDPKFKALVLGEQAKITFENGHAFIGKAMLTAFWRSRPWECTIHLRSAEHTTGRSMKVFLDSVPRRRLAAPSTFLVAEMSPLAFAAKTGLSLYIMESLAHTPNLLRDSHEKLLSSVIRLDPDVNDRLTGQDPPTIARLLLDNGFTLDKDRGAFKTMIRNLNHPHIYEGYVIVGLSQAFVEYGQRVDIRVRDRKRGQGTHYTPLHASYRTPSLIAFMLDKGADVNALDGKKRTPLDYIFDMKLGPLGSYYESISMLLQRGGKVNTTRRAAIREGLQELSDEGFETERLSFRRLGRYRAARAIVGPRSTSNIPASTSWAHCVVQ
ncbi:hypothetical protein F5B21DRAFT_473095 [Xylaria acuta]|nr:hypothetical protein F5B21DRAFT_473095 [Xylaria acuta]